MWRDEKAQELNGSCSLDFKKVFYTVSLMNFKPTAMSNDQKLQYSY